MTSSESSLLREKLPIQVKEYKVGNHNIFLPLDHALDRYQSTWKRYDIVLANVAQIIFQKYPKLTAIDIGANVGDSAALINKYIQIPVLCIEGYYEFLPFLEYNAAQIGGIEIAPYFVGKDGETFVLEQVSSQSGTASIVKTSQEISSNNQIILKSLSTILDLHPEFKSSKLLKIDVDGYDFDIINQSIDIINSLQPIICFEYDINFRESGEIESLEAIQNLINIGYSYFLIYDNFGNYLINLNDNDYEKFLDLNTYLICNRRKSGTVAVFYFDIYAFPSDDYDLFCLIRDTEIYG